MLRASPVFVEIGINPVTAVGGAIRSLIYFLAKHSRQIRQLNQHFIGENSGHLPSLGSRTLHIFVNLCHFI